MKNLSILILGNNQEILVTLERVIKNNGWNPTVLFQTETCFEYLENHSTDLILLSSGLEKDFEEKVKEHPIILSKQIKVLEHFGGGSGLLKCEIYQLFPELVTS